MHRGFSYDNSVVSCITEIMTQTKKHGDNFKNNCKTRVNREVRLLLGRKGKLGDHRMYFKNRLSVTF